jgi:hypothetical protein
MVSSLVYLLVTSVSVLEIMTGVPTMIITMSFLPVVVDGRADAAMPAGSW